MRAGFWDWDWDEGGWVGGLKWWSMYGWVHVVVEEVCVGWGLEECALCCGWMACDLDDGVEFGSGEVGRGEDFERNGISAVGRDTMWMSDAKPHVELISMRWLLCW